MLFELAHEVGIAAISEDFGNFADGGVRADEHFGCEAQVVFYDVLHTCYAERGEINSVEICSADVHFGAYLINAPAACRGGTNAPPKLQKLPVSENIGNLRFLRTAQLLADVEQNHSQRVIIEIAVGIVVINLLCVHGFYKIVNNNIFAQLNRLV